MNRTLIAIALVLIAAGSAMAADEEKWISQPPEIPSAFIGDNWCLVTKYDFGALYGATCKLQKPCY